MESNNRVGSFFVLIAIAVLAACSNGSGSLSDPSTPPPSGGTPPPTTPPPTTPPPPPPTDPQPSTPGAGLAGYWKGSATQTDGNPVHEAIALIDHGGETQFMVLAGENDDDPQFVLHGNLCCEIENEEGEVAGKRFLNSRNEEAEMDIRRDGDTLRGRFEFRDREYDFDLSFSSEYTRGLTIASLAGVYTQALGLSTLTLTIDADGQLTGSHSNGCVVNGTVSIPETARNMAALTYDMTGCGSGVGSSRSWNGRYTGVGLLLLDTSMPGTPANADVFYHSTVGPTWLGPQSVGR